MFFTVKKFRFRIFIFLLLSFVVTYFLQDNYKFVKDISKESLKWPVQTDVSEENPINFNKNGFAYSVHPVADYDISGLVVHKLDYNKWYSLSRTDELFTTDLCVIWGGNLRSGNYRSLSTSVSQDQRFCFFKYSYDKPMNNSEISNNHLLVNNPKIEKALADIRAGDQVRIRGFLADVNAVVLGETKKYEWKEAGWKTSVSRDDGGAGACEIIYVTDLQILKKGNFIFHLLHDISKWAILLVVVWVLGEMLGEAFGGKTKARY